MKCWEKIKSFFKRLYEAEEPKPETKVAEPTPAPEAAEKKAARAPKKKADSSGGTQ